MSAFGLPSVTWVIEFKDESTTVMDAEGSEKSIKQSAQKSFNKEVVNVRPMKESENISDLI